MIHTDKLGSAVRRCSSPSEDSPVELGSLNPFFLLKFYPLARASLSDQASFLSEKFTGDLGALIERHLLDAGKLLGVIAPFKTRAPPVHIYVQQVICNVINHIILHNALHKITHVLSLIKYPYITLFRSPLVRRGSPRP